nr:lysozyme inhibitor LprI family protein [Nereida sp. MMG025]
MLIAALFAGAAQANGFEFSPEATDSCTVTADDPMSCVMASANDCMSGNPGGSSTAGMMRCISLEYDYWDARLNAAYQLALQEAEAADEEAKTYGYTPPKLAEPLRAMQRAWIPFRDATCAFERAKWGGGTGGGPASAACLVQETARQTFELERGVRLTR